MAEYGMVFPASTIAQKLKETNLQQTGRKTWPEFSLQNQLMGQAVQEELTQQFGQQMGQAYNVFQAQQQQLAGSALGAGARGYLQNQLSQATEQAYAAAGAELQGQRQQVEEYVAAGEEQIQGALMQQADMTKQYIDSHLDYLDWLWEQNPQQFADEVWGRFTKVAESEALTDFEVDRLRQLTADLSDKDFLRLRELQRKGEGHRSEAWEGYVQGYLAEEADVKRINDRFSQITSGGSVHNYKNTRLDSIKSDQDVLGPGKPFEGYSDAERIELYHLIREYQEVMAQGRSDAYFEAIKRGENALIGRTAKEEKEMQTLIGKSEAGQQLDKKQKAELEGLLSKQRGDFLSPSEREELQKLEGKIKGGYNAKGEIEGLGKDTDRYNELVAMSKGGNIEQKRQLKSRQELLTGEGGLYQWNEETGEYDMTMAGLDFFSQIQNANIGENTFGQFLSETNPDLLEWSQSSNPYDFTFSGMYQDEEGNWQFPGSQKGSFRTMMGLASTEDTWAFAKRFGGMSEEQITKMYDRFETAFKEIGQYMSGTETKNYMREVQRFTSDLNGLIDDLGITADFERDLGMSMDQFSNAVQDMFTYVKTTGELNREAAGKFFSNLAGGTLAGVSVGGMLPGGPVTTIGGAIVGSLIGLGMGIAEATKTVKKGNELNNKIADLTDQWYRGMLNSLVNYSLQQQKQAEIDFNKQIRQF